MTLKVNTEGTATNKHNEEFNIRIYKDGGAKVESCNSLEFFDSIEDLEKYIVANQLTIIELLSNA